MVIPQSILDKYKNVYDQVAKLVDEDSQEDSTTDPYKSFYAAGDLLDNMLLSLSSDLAKNDLDNTDIFTYNVIKAYACCDLGCILLAVEDFNKGEKYLLECIEFLKNHTLKPEVILAYLKTLNKLGTIFTRKENYQNALERHLELEKSYIAFKELNIKPLTIMDIFNGMKEIIIAKGQQEMDEYYTQCCFHIAELYGFIRDMEKSAKYCHLALKRHLIFKSYEPIEFAIHTAALSQYFIEQKQFQVARHHLAAATYIMKEYESKQLKDNNNPDDVERFKYRYADVARCWAKYGILLLEASKNRLYNDDDDNVLPQELKKLQLDDKLYKFHNLNLETYENSITSDYCLTFADAKKVYHFVDNWLNNAKQYYKSDTEASQYSKIIMDYAELYEHLAFFEENPSNQIKMHKRRAKYYEELIALLNPTYYMDICRECWYGAGSAYLAIKDIKLDCIKDKETTDNSEFNKINKVCQQAIKNFQNFITSYTKESNDENEKHGILYAYFHLGCLYYKIRTSEPAIDLDNLNLSLKYYKIFVESCNKSEITSKSFRSEISISLDMMSLLPKKIEYLKRISK